MSARARRVAFIDIADAPSKALADRIEASAGVRPLYINADLRDIEALRAAVAKAAEAHGPVTVLINNAAFDQRHAIEEVTEDFWDNNQAINLRPHFFTAQAVAPGMKAAGKGSIINFTSTSFLINHPDMPSYTAAKAGIIGLTKGLAGKLGAGRHPRQRHRAGLGHHRTPAGAVGHRGRARRPCRQAVHPRSHAARRHGRPLPVPRIRRLAHADRADHDRRRRLPVTPTPAVAAVDWGTSSFRLWLLDASGAVLAEKRSGEGMLTAGAEGFAVILERHLAAVGAPADLPVIVCGMAGARQGWLEAPYVALPAALDAILAGAVPFPARRREIRILPGLAQRSTDAPDVMRGEETQLAGILPLFAAGSH